VKAAATNLAPAIARSQPIDTYTLRFGSTGICFLDAPAEIVLTAQGSSKLSASTVV
jgi:hypothetical protein